MVSDGPGSPRNLQLDQIWLREVYDWSFRDTCALVPAVDSCRLLCLCLDVQWDRHSIGHWTMISGACGTHKSKPTAVAAQWNPKDTKGDKVKSTYIKQKQMGQVK